MSYMKREQDAIDRDIAIVREALEDQRDVEASLVPGVDETPRETKFADALAALDRLAYRVGASSPASEPKP